MAIAWKIRGWQRKRVEQVDGGRFGIEMRKMRRCIPGVLLK